jgi:hypothetical protein
MSDARSRPRFHPSRGPRGPERQVSHESGSGHPVDPRLCRPAVRPLLALAALLLVTLGLTWLVEPAPLRGPPSGGGTLVALLAPREGGIKAQGMDVAHAALHPGPEATGMGTRSAVSARVAPILLRKELEEGKRTGRLPPPPTEELAGRKVPVPVAVHLQAGAHRGSECGRQKEDQARKIVVGALGRKVQSVLKVCVVNGGRFQQFWPAIEAKIKALEDSPPGRSAR